MSVVCFEGPNAAGKSALARSLEISGKASVVAEVNHLYARPDPMPDFWYFDRQVDRSRTAANMAGQGRLAILDGDPFQPLWYNWAYGFAGSQPLGVMADVYRMALNRKGLRFPNHYVIFEAHLGVLRKRKEWDTNRQRRNFEKHTRFIGPQRRYFEFLRSIDPQRVTFFPCEGNVDELKTRMLVILAGLKPPTLRSDELFDRLVHWLETNQP